MVLTIDVGNTNITLGAYEADTLLFVSRLATDRLRTGDQYAIEMKDIFLLNGIAEGAYEGAIISCVVPELSAAICHAVEKVTGRQPLVVGAGVKTGLHIRTDNPDGLGADLVVGAVAAIARYPLPCLVMDLGTATKVSVIDADGTFVGCTISAGVAISLDALATRTSQLPHISLEPPHSVIGVNTEECMRAGTVLGTADMLDGLADRIERALGCQAATIVATGGLAREIVPHCRRTVIYQETLLLDGLKLLFDQNR